MEIIDRRHSLGFDKGYITIFKGDQAPYEDWFKASIARFHNQFKWYIVSTDEIPEDLPEGLAPVRLEASKIFVGDTQDLLPEAERLKNIEELLYGESKSNYFGTVGYRYDLVLKCIYARSSEGNYGTQMFYIFEDKNGNIFTWNTTSRLLDVEQIYACRGTVKSHDIYHARKQTTLTRVMNFKEKEAFDET